MFYCGISFLAGFSIKQVTEKLEELTKTLFSVNKNSEDQNTGKQEK